MLTPVETTEAPKQEHDVVFLEHFFDELRRCVPAWANDVSLADLADRAWASEAVAVRGKRTLLAPTKSPPPAAKAWRS